MTNIITKLRYILGDCLIATGRQEFNFLSVASSRVFTMFNSNIDASTIKVYKNGVEWSSDNYTYNSDTAQLIVSEESGEELVPGDTLLVTFSYYEKYSDTELEGYIKASLSYLSVEQYETFEITTADELDPEPTTAQEHLIALVASCLVPGANIQSYRTPEITVNFTSRETPDQKIKKLVRQFKKAYGILEYIQDDISAADSE